MGQNALSVLLAAGTQSGPELVGHGGYFLFHNVAELVAITVSSCIILLAWNARKLARNSGLTFIVFSFLLVTIADIIHLLVYAGTAALPSLLHGLDPELWRISRLVQAISFIVAAATIGRRPNIRAVTAVYSVLALGILVAVAMGLAPAAWMRLADIGVWRSFWITCDLFTGTCFIAAAIMFRSGSGVIEPRAARLMAASAAVLACCEWAMALYPLLGLPMDVIAHCLEVTGFCIVYRAIVEAGVIHPYHLMVRDLQKNESMLRQSLAESRKQKAETDALLQGTHYIIANLPFEETAGRVFSACRQLIGAAGGHFFLCEGDGKCFSLDGKPCLSIPSESYWEHLTQRVISSGKSLRHSGSLNGAPAPEGSGAEVLAVPMLDKDSIYGTLVLFGKPEGFDAGDIEMAEAFAELVSIAMSNRRARQGLAESEKQLRSLVSHVPGAVYRSSFSETRAMEFVSERIEEITGYPAADFVHGRVRTYASIINPADVDSVRRHLNAAISARQPYDMEYRVTNAIGETRWVRDHGCGNYDDSGNLISLDGAVFDITHRRLAEEELQESRRMLEMKVAARTAELRRTNEQLQSQIHERKKLEKLILRASEREQQRIGQELHDGIGQELAGLSFMVAALSRRLAGKLPQEGKSTAEILELVQKTINEVRGVAKGLYPVEVRSGGLQAALGELAANTRKLFGLTCTFSSDESFEVHDAGVATHVYRIAQEAVSNAVKHARARNIAIHLKKSEGHAILTLANDGNGFSVENVGSSGMGLQIMRYRADVIGGMLEVASVPEGRTTVRCVFPNESDLFDGKAEW